MKISTNKYEAVFKDYSEALSWMEEIGVKISSGRTQHYMVLPIVKTKMDQK